MEDKYILCYHKFEHGLLVENVPVFFKAKDDLLDFVGCCKKEELKNDTTYYVFYFAGEVSNQFYID